jgi:hypothetical protein
MIATAEPHQLSDFDDIIDRFWHSANRGSPRGRPVPLRHPASDGAVSEQRVTTEGIHILMRHYAQPHLDTAIPARPIMTIM